MRTSNPVRNAGSSNRVRRRKNDGVRQRTAGRLGDGGMLLATPPEERGEDTTPTLGRVIARDMRR